MRLLKIKDAKLLIETVVMKEMLIFLLRFVKSGQIMLINSPELFNDNIEPLRSLLAAASMDDFCHLNSKEAINKKGMEIMQANKNYDLAH
jgi:hypothetical protein